MSNLPQAFQFLIIWHPTPDQAKEGRKSEIIVDLTTILSSSKEAASMTAAMRIPDRLKEEIDQIQIAIRPF